MKNTRAFVEKTCALLLTKAYEVNIEINAGVGAFVINKCTCVLYR